MLQRSCLSSIRSLTCLHPTFRVVSACNYTTQQKKTEKTRRNSQESSFPLSDDEKNILTYKSYKVPKMHNEMTTNMDTGVRSEKGTKIKSQKDLMKQKLPEFKEPKVTRDGFNGVRLMKFPNGDIYEGQFLKGEKSGKGKMIYARGNVYDGDWNRNVRDGYGIFTLKDGKQYEGEWVRGKQQGSIIVRFTSGDVLTCTCHNEKLEGHGTIAYANGDKFEGMFSRGYKNGGGILTRSDGTKQVGLWKDGKYRPMPTVPTPSAHASAVDSPQAVMSSIRNSFTPVASSVADSSGDVPAAPKKLNRGVRVKEYQPLD